MKKVEAQNARLNFTHQHPLGLDDKCVPQFYQSIAEYFKFSESKIAFIVVAHQVHTLPYFIEALTKLGIVVSLIPKASRCVSDVMSSIDKSYHEIISHVVNKETLKNDIDTTSAFIHEISKQYQDYKLIILDHGGYFAHSINILIQFAKNLTGIVEHTWNGEIKYRKCASQRLPFRIFSIARSRLKAYEDEHVARSIVDVMSDKIFSGDGLNQVISRVKIGIIGYGHMGEAVAQVLREKIGSTQSIRICDSQETARKRAAVIFSNVSGNKEDILRESDIIITATSSLALNREDFATIKSGATIVCVTSSDDQFTADALADCEINPEIPDKYVTAYKNKKTDKIFYLAANGGSVNFLSGSTPHPILHAILGSVCVSALRCCQHLSLVLKEQDYVNSNNNNNQSSNNNNSINQSIQSPLEEISASDMIKIEEIYEKHFGRINYTVDTFGLYRLSCHFVGRKKEQEQLRKILQRTQIGVITQSIAGLGGMGKTTLARKFAEESLTNKEYDFIFHLYAGDEKSLYEQFVLLAIKLGIVEPQKIEPKELVVQVYHYLVRYRRILIIFDNAPSYHTLHNAWIRNESINFLPPLRQDQLVHCVITTRNQQFTSDEKIILQALNPDEAVDYIRHHLPYVTSNEAEKLAKTLCYFPLALCQAVAYILVHTDCTIENYIELYKTQQTKQREFLSSTTLPEDPYQETVYTTWNISLQSLKLKSPSSVNLINTLSYFAAQPIPYSLLAYINNNQQLLYQALIYLEKYSLAEINDNDYSLRIHELVQTVVRLKQQEIAHETASLEQALKIAYQYGMSLSDISPFIVHGLQVVKFHQNSLPSTATDQKIELLLNIGNCQYLTLLFPEHAFETYKFAKTIYLRAPVKKHYIHIQLGLVNCCSGAAKPLKYVELLDELSQSDDLKIEDIEEILQHHGIEVDFKKAKDKLLDIQEISLLLPSAHRLDPRTFFKSFLNSKFKDLRSLYTPYILASIGAMQLAIIYYLYKGELRRAKQMAIEYLKREDHNAYSLVEASFLYIQTAVLQGDADIKGHITTLETAARILRETPIDKFWDDQVQIVLSFLYAANGKYNRSYEIAFALLDRIERHVPFASRERSTVERIKTSNQFLEFFEQQSTHANSIFAQAFRIIGRLLMSLQQFSEAEDCYKKALKYGKNCALTYFEYACLLYRDKSRHDEAMEHLITTTAITMSTKEQALFYKYFPREVANLPRCMREVLKDNTQFSVALDFLAYTFLVLLHHKNGEQNESLDYLKLLDKNLQTQPNFLGQKLIEMLKQKISRSRNSIFASNRNISSDATDHSNDHNYSP